MLKVGLTGGIGSGKSAVSALFRKYDVPVIDADEIAHQLTAVGGPALAEIVDCFGRDLLRPDGTLDRAALAAIIFADNAQRLHLEAILHPLIVAEMESRLLMLQADYVILAIPLLVESGLERLCDRILVVTAAMSTRYARLRRRDGFTDAVIERIVASQATDDERLALASDVIRNDGSLDDLRRQVAALHRQYLEASVAQARS